VDEVRGMKKGGLRDDSRRPPLTLTLSQGAREGKVCHSEESGGIFTRRRENPINHFCHSEELRRFRAQFRENPIL